MGISCSLGWREAGEKERLWICNPRASDRPGSRPLLRANEYRDVWRALRDPDPAEIIFISWFAGGEVFRSGCTWKRGNGKIFYFRPGHKVYPIYHDKNVQRVLRRAAPDGERWIDRCPMIPVEAAPEPLTAQGPKLHRQGESGFR